MLAIRFARGYKGPNGATELREGSMTQRSDRVLYVGTADGLYLVDEQDGEFEAKLIGFQSGGVMRAPVVQDADDPRRLYAGTTKWGTFVSEDHGTSWQEMNRGIVYKN